MTLPSRAQSRTKVSREARVRLRAADLHARVRLTFGSSASTHTHTPHAAQHAHVCCVSCCACTRRRRRLGRLARKACTVGLSPAGEGIHAASAAVASGSGCGEGGMPAGGGGWRRGGWRGAGARAMARRGCCRPRTAAASTARRSSSSRARGHGCPMRENACMRAHNTTTQATRLHCRVLHESPRHPPCVRVAHSLAFVQSIDVSRPYERPSATRGRITDRSPPC